LKDSLYFENIKKMNEWSLQQKPFVFLIDYRKEKCLLWEPETAAKAGFWYNFNGRGNGVPQPILTKHIDLHKYPIDFETYQQAFNEVLYHLQRGDSFLVNLTCVTPVKTSLSLSDIYVRSKAKYQVLYEGQFVCFSPEVFVQIKDGIISTHPMKGTIDARVPDAKNLILNDIKEKAEHTTIVDLMRNDLSMVCTKVWVERFRYVDPVKTHNGELLQVSSEIKGELSPHFQSHIGDLLDALLPAGSICGAPKPDTLRIIERYEKYERNFYTGISGYFDGRNLDTGVMIRFIEQTPQGLVFKSGGGITARSQAAAEYQEMIDKIYLPIS
jgi:para-aminobenzoate synthetase component I